VRTERDTSSRGPCKGTEKEIRSNDFDITTDSRKSNCCSSFSNFDWNTWWCDKQSDKFCSRTNCHKLSTDFIARASGYKGEGAKSGNIFPEVVTGAPLKCEAEVVGTCDSNGAGS
jgi:hypothetical protein